MVRDEALLADNFCLLDEWLSAAKIPQLAAIAASQSSPEERVTRLKLPLSPAPAKLADSKQNIKNNVRLGNRWIRAREMKGRFLWFFEGVTSRRFCDEMDIIRPESGLKVRVDCFQRGELNPRCVQTVDALFESDGGGQRVRMAFAVAFDFSRESAARLA